MRNKPLRRLTYVTKENAGFKEHIEVYYFGHRVGSLNRFSDEYWWEFLSYPDSEFSLKHFSLDLIKNGIRTYCDNRRLREKD